MALLSPTGRLLDAYRRARALIGRGGAFRLAGGRLAGTIGPARDGLAAALSALNGREPCPPRPFPVRETADGRRSVAYLWPLATDFRTVYGLVVLDAGDRGKSAYQAFSRLHGLSGAEAAVLEGLCRGRTLATIAKQRRVTRNTVRSQLKSLLAKTGCHSQGQLLALYARLAPPLD